jgi:uncharacterized membrane protein YfcA
VAIPVVSGFKAYGFTTDGAVAALHNLTGFHATQQKMDWTKAGTMAVILLAESTIGRKLANRTGLNRMVRKATGNMVQVF